MKLEEVIHDAMWDRYGPVHSEDIAGAFRYLVGLVHSSITVKELAECGEWEQCFVCSRWWPKDRLIADVAFCDMTGSLCTECTKHGSRP